MVQIFAGPLLSKTCIYGQDEHCKTNLLTNVINHVKEFHFLEIFVNIKLVENLEF